MNNLTLKLDISIYNRVEGVAPPDKTDILARPSRTLGMTQSWNVFWQPKKDRPRRTLMQETRHMGN